MIKIEVDEQVFEKIKEVAIPFEDISPNSVLRRLLGLPKKNLVKGSFTSDDTGVTRELSDQTSEMTFEYSKHHGIGRDGEKLKYRRPPQEIIHHPADHMFNERIEKLRKASMDTHSAFLTFLMDKYLGSRGNYKTSQIIDFMEKMNLKSVSGILRNPWMKAPYKGENNGKISCQRTIEHFRQTRKFGCWNGRDIKAGCDNLYCIYHPANDLGFKNKCDLRNGVIWKRKDPDSPFNYGTNYTEVVKNQLLKGRKMPLQPLLSVLYPNNRNYDDSLINHFTNGFNFSDEEMEAFFIK